MKKYFSALVLNGGSSSRMGTPKFNLKFDENYSFIEKIDAVLRESGIENIFYVFNHNLVLSQKFRNSAFYKQSNIVINYYPHLGRTYSILLGLEKIAPNHFCFIANIDNPFLETFLINDLATAIDSADYCVPMKDSKGGHPILISPFVIKLLRKEKLYDKSLKELLLPFKRKEVQVNADSPFININTPEDYYRFTGYLNHEL